VILPLIRGAAVLFRRCRFAVRGWFQSQPGISSAKCDSRARDRTVDPDIDLIVEVGPVSMG